MADKYVRKGATGSGTGADWTNAYTDFNNVSWSGMSGSTLWVAAGNYTSGCPELTVANVTIKRATNAVHGAASGWNTAYDNQVNLTPQWLWVTANGAVIDGATHNPWLFALKGQGAAGQIKITGYQKPRITGFTVRNMEFDGQSVNDGTSEDGIQVDPNGVDNFLMEYCKVHDYRQLGYTHQDAIQVPETTGITIRYNWIYNNGMLLYLGDLDWGSSHAANVHIHHNVFYSTSDCIEDQIYRGINTNGMSGWWRVENNTFAIKSQLMYSWGGAARGCLVNTKASTPFTTSNLTFKNNICYSSDPAYGTVGTHTNNCYFFLSGDNASWATAPSETGRVITNPLFVDASGYNFQLQSGSPCATSGANLGYTEDILGNAIGSSNISMGAYQYGSGSPPTGTITLSVR